MEYYLTAENGNGVKTSDLNTFIRYITEFANDVALKGETAFEVIVLGVKINELM